MERLQKTIFGGSPMSESVNPGQFTSVGSLTKKMCSKPSGEECCQGWEKIPRIGKKSQTNRMNRWKKIFQSIHPLILHISLCHQQTFKALAKGEEI
jgi:hypothetical protein